ncbi:hypothetical protein LCGC14_2232870 [marine sediment metagenome]|uniref:CopG-like ribbon-helix-helix domain-containing protein n=1 Tax=marine sediment metagenome TaxID=412755 RepID=A0A0F9DVC9_9ZZZZ
MTPRISAPYLSGMAKRRRPLQAVDLERIVVYLPKSAVKELDAQAETEALSRSAFIRLVVVRYLRERGEKE